MAKTSTTITASAKAKQAKADKAAQVRIDAAVSYICTLLSLSNVLALRVLRTFVSQSRRVMSSDSKKIFRTQFDEIARKISSADWKEKLENWLQIALDEIKVYLKEEKVLELRYILGGLSKAEQEQFELNAVLPKRGIEHQIVIDVLNLGSAVRVQNTAFILKGVEAMLAELDPKEKVAELSTDLKVMCTQLGVLSGVQSRTLKGGASCFDLVLATMRTIESTTQQYNRIKPTLEHYNTAPKKEKKTL